MAFPAGPINGQTYTSAHGTKYVFSTAANGWLIDTTASGSGVSLPTNASGYLKNDGIGTLTWGVTQNYSEGAIAPASPTNGDEWYDTGASALKKRIAGAWVAQGGSSGGGRLLATGALNSGTTVDVINLSGWESLRLVLSGGTSGVPRVYVSSNNGSTFYSTIGDYNEYNIFGGVEDSSGQILPKFRTGNLGLIDFINFGTPGQTAWVYHGGTMSASAGTSYAWGIGPSGAMNALRLLNSFNVNSYTYYVLGCNSL